MSFDRPFAEAVPRTPFEVVHKSYPYFNAEGRCVAVMSVELELAEIDESLRELLSPTSQVFRLRKAILAGPNSADGEVDILQLTRSRATSIFLARAENYAHLEWRGEQVVFAPPLDTVRAFGALLHELGHAAQSLVPVFRQLDMISQERTPEVAQSISALVEGLETPPTEQELARMKELEREQQVIYREFERLVHEVGSRSLSAEQRSALHQRMEQLEVLSEACQHELATLDERRKQAERIYELPGLILERDATLRAVLWLQEISRLIGVDLVSEIYKKSTILTTEEQQQELRSRSLRLLRGLSRGLESSKLFDGDLYGALLTYGATSFLMRKKYGGKIPRVKSSVSEAVR